MQHQVQQRVQRTQHKEYKETHPLTTSVACTLDTTANRDYRTVLHSSCYRHAD